MDPQNVPLVIAGVAILIAVALLLPLRWPQSKKRGPQNFVFRDDNQGWYGFLYYNPDDPNVIVPRRYGIGWTVNFGRPAGKLFAILMLILILMPLIMLFVPGYSPAKGCHLLNCSP